MWVTRAMLAQAPAGTDDFWYMPISMTTAAGVPVSADTAMRLSVVYACVRVKAEAAAKIPLELLRGFDVVKDHPVARLLARKPNRWQTSFEWREMMQAHLELRGNAYSRICFDRAGNVAELVPLHPDRVTLVDLPDGDWRYRHTDLQGRTVDLVRYEVLHLKQLSTDGRLGTSTIGAQREGIATALATQDYAGRTWRNGARHSGMWVEMPGKFANDDHKRKWREDFRASQTGANAGQTPVMDQGMKLHELGMSNADAQFIESRKHSDNDLCRMFLVPPHKVGILERSTNNNIEHQGREFYGDTMMGVFRRWEEALETSLLTEEEWDDLRIEFDVAELLRADTAGRTQFYQAAITSGWLTRNEVREREKYAPLPGLDKPLEPLNMNTAGDKRPGSNGARPAPTEDEDEPPKARALLVAAADRCVTREVNAVQRIVDRYSTGPSAVEQIVTWYEAHAAFCRQVLLITDDEAASLCAARIDELKTNDVAKTLARWRAGAGALLLEYL